MKSQQPLQEYAKAFALCDTIIFDGRVSNQEALWLERFRKELGYRLVSPQTYAYGVFVRELERISGTKQSIDDESEVCIVFGSRVADDAPEIFAALFDTAETVTYMHPIADERWDKRGASFIKYEALAEEGVAAMLLYGFAQALDRSAFPDDLTDFLDEIDIGFISAETSVGEEEIEMLLSRVGKRACTIIVGRDLYEHPRAVQIATLLGYIERYTGISVRCIPPFVNANGVLEICTLSKTAGERSIGYLHRTDNQTDHELCSSDLKDMERPDGEVIDWRGNRETLSSFQEYSLLLESLFALLLKQEERIGMHRTIAYEGEGEPNGILDSEIEICDPLDGTVVYLCTPALDDPFRCREVCDTVLPLDASSQFARVAKAEDGAVILFEIDGKTYRRMLRIDTEMKGMIAITPACDIDLSISSVSLSRFRCISIRKEENV